MRISKHIIIFFPYHTKTLINSWLFRNLMMDKLSFFELGSRILFCDEICEGVENDIKKGIIPRVLILCTLDGKISMKNAKLCVFGINPGNYLPFENLYYKEVIEKWGDNRIAVFKDIHDTWVSEFLQ